MEFYFETQIVFNIYMIPIIYMFAIPEIWQKLQRILKICKFPQRSIKMAKETMFRELHNTIELLMQQTDNNLNYATLNFAAKNGSPEEKLLKDIYTLQELGYIDCKISTGKNPHNDTIVMVSGLHFTPKIAEDARALRK